MDYYEIDSRKYSFAEYWRLAPWAVPVTWTMKVLGRRIDFAQAVPYPTRIDRLDPADVPADHAAWLRERIGECERCGLRLRFFYREPAIFAGIESTGAVLLADDGHTMAFLAYAKHLRSAKAQGAVALVTRLRGAGTVETTTEKKRFGDPPGADVARYAGATVEELLARHRERVRRRGEVIEAIAESELEDFVAAESDDAKRVRIERGVLVPCPPEKLERLRAGESADRPPSPRRTWSSRLRTLAVWVGIWIAVILLWSHFGTDRTPMSPESRSIRDLMSTSTRLSLSCSDLPEAPPRPESPFRRHGFTAAGVFADADAAARAEADLRPQADDGDVVRLGPVVFFRHAGAEGVDPSSWRPIDTRLWRLGARVLVEAPGYEKIVSASLLWQIDDPAAADELETALAAYFAAPYYFALRAPWVPPDVAAPLTAAERRARRHYLVLSRSGQTPGFDYVRRYVQVVRQRDPDAFNELMEEEKRQHVERQSRQVEKLREELPDLDPELARRYLDFVDAPPFLVAGDPEDAAHQKRADARMDELYRRGAALGELMGQLAYRWRAEPGRAPEVVDPAQAYSVGGAEVERDGGEFRLETLLFDDVALGLPAFLAALCGDGATDFVLTLDDYDDVRVD